MADSEIGEKLKVVGGNIGVCTWRFDYPDEKFQWGDSNEANSESYIVRCLCFMFTYYELKHPENIYILQSHGI